MVRVHILSQAQQKYFQCLICTRNWLGAASGELAAPHAANYTSHIHMLTIDTAYTYTHSVAESRYIERAAQR